MTEKKKEGELKKVKKFFHEFKEFAVKGNMIDMAVGVIVGGAFTAVVTSIVGNIVTPLIGILIGVDFKEWSIELPRLYGNAEPSTLGIGLFLNSLISFVIVAFTVFLFVKALNKFRNKNIISFGGETIRDHVLAGGTRDQARDRSSLGQRGLRYDNRDFRIHDTKLERQAHELRVYRDGRGQFTAQK